MSRQKKAGRRVPSTVAGAPAPRPTGKQIVGVCDCIPNRNANPVPASQKWPKKATRVAFDTTLVVVSLAVGVIACVTAGKLADASAGAAAFFGGMALVVAIGLLFRDERS